MNNFNAFKKQRQGSDTHAATNPRPGNYELGSLQSRVAARLLDEKYQNEETVIQIIYDHMDGTQEYGPNYRIPALKRSAG